MSIVRGLKLSMMVVFGAITLQASPVSWTLQNVTFTDGGTAAGSFVFDADLGQYSQINVVTTAGSILAGATYLYTTAYSAVGVLDFGSATPLLIGSTFIDLIPVSPLTNAGGTIALAPTSGLTGIEGVCASSEPCAAVGTYRTLNAGGSVSSTQVPEASSLTLVSYGALALATRQAYRKRRKPL